MLNSFPAIFIWMYIYKFFILSTENTFVSKLYILLKSVVEIRTISTKKKSDFSTKFEFYRIIV